MKSKEPSDVPKHIYTSLSLVISARKEFAAQYKHKVNPTDTQSQNSIQGHDHFIGVLQTVQQILQGEGKAHIQASRDKPHNTPITEPKGNISLTDRFEKLELQEPMQWLGQNRGVYTIPPAQIHASSGFRGSENFEANGVDEGSMASYFFFKDYFGVRDYVRSIWKEYREQRVSLSAAALTTEMAFDIIGKLYHDLPTDFPVYNTYEALDRVVLDNPTLAPLAGPTLAMPRTGSEKSNANHYNRMAPLPGREAFSALRFMVDAGNTAGQPTFTRVESPFNWSTISEASPPVPTQEEMMNIIMLAITDMTIFVRLLGGPNSPADGLSSGIFSFCKSLKPPAQIPVALAFQLFLDIHLALLHDLERPFGELLNSAAHAKTSIVKHDIHAGLPDADDGLTNASKLLTPLKGFMDEHVRKDAVNELVSARGMSRKNMPAFFLLKHHPVLCGTLQFHINSSLYRGGLTASNLCDCVIGVAHLYNAARQSNYLPCEWPDMEEIIRHYGAEYVFVGNRPTSVNNYYKRYQLALGTQLTGFARDRKSHKPETCADKIRVGVSSSSRRFGR